MARRGRIPQTYKGLIPDHGIGSMAGEPQRDARSMDGHSREIPNGFPRSEYSAGEQALPQGDNPTAKEGDHWTVERNTFPLFPVERGFNKIPKKLGKVGGIRLEKKMNGKFRAEMVRMPDGRIDSTPYDNQKFSAKDIEELYGPGDYKVTLYSDITAGGQEIFVNYWTIGGGEVRPFPCCIPPSAQGFPAELDDDPEFNPTQLKGEREEPDVPEHRGFGGRDVPNMFDQSHSPFGGGGGFGARPFGRPEEPKEEKQDFLKILTGLATILTPIITPVVTSYVNRGNLQTEIDRQRMEREEERERQRAEDKRREREHELKIEEERERRRADESRARADEERRRIEWDDRRRREDEERIRARDDYEEKKRLDAEERQARIDEQRRILLQQQFETAKPQIDPQIVAMVKALDNKMEMMSKGGALGGLKETLKEFSTMRDELAALGLAGGSAPQDTGGLESFIGRVVGSIPPERALALVKTIGGALGMLPPGMDSPAEISLTG